MAAVAVSASVAATHCFARHQFARDLWLGLEEAGVGELFVFARVKEFLHELVLATKVHEDRAAVEFDDALDEFFAVAREEKDFGVLDQLIDSRHQSAGKVGNVFLDVFLVRAGEE